MNEKADALAKSLCQEQFQQHSDHSLGDVNCILAVQIHFGQVFCGKELVGFGRLIQQLFQGLFRVIYGRFRVGLGLV